MHSLHKDSSILIIGAGTFGTSTAYHLARRGYTNITCIDRHHWPSPDSAGYDLNKIVRTEYDEPLYTQLALEALDAWRGEEWQGIFHETGRIACISGERDSPEFQYLRDSYENLRRVGQGSQVKLIEDKQDVVAYCPQLANAPGIDTWKGLWNCEGGWVHAKKALEHWSKKCEEMGVRIISGGDGTMIGLDIDREGSLIGIRTKSGKVHKSDHYILSTGAASPGIVPELLATQLWSKCWTLAHIELTAEEIEQWRGIPVLDNQDLGYTFEPDPETGWMKICNEFAGYQHKTIHVDTKTQISVEYSIPRYASDHPDDGIPQEAIDGIKAFIDAVMPQFSNKQLLGARLCWCADSPDSHWLIDRHPDHSSLLLATGDSVHAFKMFPTIGRYIADALEGSENGLKPQWRYGNRKWVRNVTRPDAEVKDLRDVMHIRDE